MSTVPPWWITQVSGLVRGMIGILAVAASVCPLSAAEPSAVPEFSKTQSPSIAESQPHWAYRPVPSAIGLPRVNRTAWPRTDVDWFVLAELEERGLDPSPDADPATWLRRVHFDLIGLPPSLPELEAFLQDSSPAARERVVDRLLASPRFGERWGRHWLDVARFAESVTLRGLIFSEAWRYRDYVIDAFNRDLPYDQFVREQIAGDLLASDSIFERQRRQVAVSFLTIGNANFEEQDKRQLEMDVVDEQLEAIGRGILAQTITCARCHDHKFDPIPTRDYYALAGILRSTRMLEHANVSGWVEVPLAVGPDEEAAYSRHEKALAELEGRVKEAKDRLAQLHEPVRNPTVDMPAVLPLNRLPGFVVDDVQARAVGSWQESQFTKRYIGDGYRHDQNTDKGSKTLTFHPDLTRPGSYEVRFAYTPGDNRAESVPVTVFSAEGETVVHVNQREAPTIEGRFVSLGTFRFEGNNQGYVIVSNEGTTGHVIADAVQFLPVDRPVNGPDSIRADRARLESTEPREPDRAASARAERDLKELESRLRTLKEQGPRRPKVMAVLEENPGDLAVHVRGSVHSLGETVPRGFLSAAPSDHDPLIPADQSGRRQLADWLTHPSNPLTARVWVNRVWHWMFGAGLVRTTDNYGATGEAPSHPALLDSLARRFMEEDWSTRRLIRRLALSRVYQLSSDEFPEAKSMDPENRLLGHRNRRRLDAECLRDSLLWISGALDLTMGGSTLPPGATADYGLESSQTRRGVYLPVLRNAMPEMFELFDFANPSMPTGRRDVSTGAPQALFFMNHPFVRAQAEAAARSMLARGDVSLEARLNLAFRLTLGRSPSVNESRLALEFLAEDNLRAWTDLYLTLFASVDFRYAY